MLAPARQEWSPLPRTYRADRKGATKKMTTWTFSHRSRGIHMLVGAALSVTEIKFQISHIESCTVRLEGKCFNTVLSDKLTCLFLRFFVCIRKFHAIFFSTAGPQSSTEQHSNDDCKRQETEAPSNQAASASHLDLNFPLPGEKGPSCLVKVDFLLPFSLPVSFQDDILVISYMCTGNWQTFKVRGRC